jgi:hypothetical protein
MTDQIHITPFDKTLNQKQEISFPKVLISIIGCIHHIFIQPKLPKNSQKASLVSRFPKKEGPISA